MSMSYAVKLDVFEGPLDLLLHLVSAERVDVAEISIATITDEYLAAVKKMDEMELEAATAFLILAATLLELKTVKLLPKGEVEDPDVAALLEERDRLLHRLIEYSTFKEAAASLGGTLEEGSGYFIRQAGLPEWLDTAAPDLLSGVTPGRLGEVAGEVFSPKAALQVDTSYVAPIRVNLRDTIERLGEEIAGKGKVSFSELCRGAVRRIEVVVRFMALLELFKSQEVDLEQGEPFSEIVVRSRRPHATRGGR